MSEYKIYPKQFLFDKLPIEKNRCFMIMPFNSIYDGIYGIIKDELGNIGISCHRADEINGSKPIMNKVISEILRSRYIIADLSECNANVFYELGIAHSFRDSRNILLIKQKNANYPFDLSHLPYIEYDPDNIFSLRATIRAFIQESRYAADFIDALMIHNISSFIVDGKNNYIEFIQDYFEDKVDIYTEILNGKHFSDENCIDEAIERYEEFLISSMASQNDEIVSGVVKVYILILSNCEFQDVIQKYARRLSDKIIMANEHFADKLSLWEMNLMISLAKNGKCLEYCMPWIIHYFSRSKASNIDLSRYRLERFLVENKNPDINGMIIDSVYSDDCHIREHMADIIGEKKLTQAYDALKNQLMIEENYYTISSIVEAIGKIAPKSDGMKTIETWIDIHGHEIIDENQFFILKHLYHGIVRLDDDDNKHGMKFMDRFKIYMQENKVGPIDL